MFISMVIILILILFYTPEPDEYSTWNMIGVELLCIPGFSKFFNVFLGICSNFVSLQCLELTYGSWFTRIKRKLQKNLPMQYD